MIYVLQQFRDLLKEENPCSSIVGFDSRFDVVNNPNNKYIFYHCFDSYISISTNVSPSTKNSVIINTDGIVELTYVAGSNVLSVMDMIKYEFVRKYKGACNFSSEEVFNLGLVFNSTEYKMYMLLKDILFSGIDFSFSIIKSHSNKKDFNLHTFKITLAEYEMIKRFE